MPLKPNERNYRIIQENLVPNDNYIIEGYALTFDRYKLYEKDGIEYFEQFKREAFENTDMSDIIMQYDHEGKVVARISNGTLEARIDDRGLFIKGDLSKSESARNLYEEIQNGLITKMSWAFPRSSEYRIDKETRTIVWEKINKIYDVSAVSTPANQNTSIYARNFVEGVIEQDLKECQEREEKRLRAVAEYSYYLELER